MKKHLITILTIALFVLAQLLPLLPAVSKP